MDNYKVISILFHLDSAVPPLDIIRDIDIYFQKKKCIVALNAFSGDVIVCSLFGKDVVNRIKSGNSIFINKKERKYKIVESNFTAVCIKINNVNINGEDVNRALRPISHVLKYDIFAEDGTFEDDVRCYQHRNYYAIIELKKDLPARIMVKNIPCNVVEV